MSLPRHTGSTSGAAPLQIQLSTTATGPGSLARVVALRATGENASGSASRPVLTRPSTLGTGTAQTAEERGPSTEPSACTLLTAFTTPPSFPSIGSGSFNLPIRVYWAASSEDDAIIVGGQGVAAGVLLYALANTGHTWSGSLVWEEP